VAAPYVRVKSYRTGHEFDVREDSHLLRDGHVKHVKPVMYPPSRYPRPTKYNTNLAGRPAAQEAPAPSGGDQTSPDPVEGTP